MLAPSDTDVQASAEVTIAEARVQIDLQVKEADSINTKAAGIVTLTGVAAGLVVGRLHVSTDQQRVATLIAAVVLATLLMSASQSLRPRGGWSFGADLRSLLGIIETYPHRVVLLALAEALVGARDQNAAALRYKQAWYARGLRTVVAALLALGWMCVVSAAAVRASGPSG